MTTLKMFDLDKTLLRSPDPPEGVWDGTLSPPFMPKVPGPEWWNQGPLQAAREATSDPDTITVLMTGRWVTQFEDRVHELLDQQGLNFDEVHLTEPEMETSEFKSQVLIGLLEDYDPDLVVVWDDDLNKMLKYRDLIEKYGSVCRLHWVVDGVKHPVPDSSFIESIFVKEDRDQRSAKDGSMGGQNLRAKLVRVAYNNPTLRDDLLPLIAPAGRPSPRRTMRRWLMSSQERWGLLSDEDRDLAGYVLRSAQERRGWHKAVDRLNRGDWGWAVFAKRAEAILKSVPGRRDPQLTDYILNKVWELYQQGEWDLLHRYTPRGLL